MANTFCGCDCHDRWCGKCHHRYGVCQALIPLLSAYVQELESEALAHSGAGPDHNPQLMQLLSRISGEIRQIMEEPETQ